MSAKINAYEWFPQLIEKLKNYYVFPEQVSTIESFFVEKIDNGVYNHYNISELAQKITEDLYALTEDKHLRVEVKLQADQEEEEEKDWEVMYAREIEKENFGFNEVKRLKGNIGYIEIRNFHKVKFAGDAAVHTMNFVRHTEALIIDLRHNGGGFPEMVSFISSYLLGSEPVHLSSFYLRENDQLQQFWTSPYVQGKRYGETKPVYILISKKTFSAAEEFAYDMQALGRAVIVGEQSAGGANPCSLFSLSENLNIFIPDGRSINTITKKNWEGTGITPDIQVNSSGAFEVTYEKTLQYVITHYKNQKEYEFLYNEAVDALCKLKEELNKLSIYMLEGTKR